MRCSLRQCKARQGNNPSRLYLAALRWRVCIKNPLISKDKDGLDEMNSPEPYLAALFNPCFPTLN